MCETHTYTHAHTRYFKIFLVNLLATSECVRNLKVKKGGTASRHAGRTSSLAAPSNEYYNYCRVTQYCTLDMLNSREYSVNRRGMARDNTPLLLIALHPKCKLFEIERGLPEYLETPLRASVRPFVSSHTHTTATYATRRSRTPSRCGLKRRAGFKRGARTCDEKSIRGHSQN